MRCLVTGGAGFIGSHLVDKLIREGHKVYIIDDLSGGTWDNLPSNFYDNEWQLDCRYPEHVDGFFKAVKPEIVFHLAANAAEGKSHFAPVDIFTRNYNSFLNVLTSGIRYGMKRIVVTSSVAVYGHGIPPFKEDVEPVPADLYGLAKLTMEKTLKILSTVHHFEYAIARAHNVYGPRQSMTDPYRNVVMIWMNKLLHNEPYTIFGDGSMKRCYTYVDDLVEGLYKLGFDNCDKEIFNLGADEAYSLKELSDAIQMATKGSIPPQFLPARPQETVTAVLDHTKAKERLGYKTTIDLTEGIKRTWHWAKQQGPKELIYGGIELESDKIPANWRQK